MLLIVGKKRESEWKEDMGKRKTLFVCLWERWRERERREAGSKKVSFFFFTHQNPVKLGVTRCDQVWPGVTKCDQVWPGVAWCGLVWPATLIFFNSSKKKHLVLPQVFEQSVLVTLAIIDPPRKHWEKKSFFSFFFFFPFQFPLLNVPTFFFFRRRTRRANEKNLLKTFLLFFFFTWRASRSKSTSCSRRCYGLAMTRPDSHFYWVQLCGHSEK